MTFLGRLRALVLTAVLTPAWALACPYCAARADSTHRTVYFIAAMCLLPLVVGGAAVAIIRRLDATSDATSEDDA